MHSFFHRDRITGIACTVLGVVVFYLSTQLPKSKTVGDPGSALFPTIIALLLFVCGICLTLRPSHGEEKAFLQPYQWKRILLLFGMYLLYTIGLEVLGFLIATPVFMFALLMALAKAAKKNIVIWKGAAYSIALTMLVYGLFQKILMVRLPEGLLF